MKYLLLILSTSILLSGELEVDGNLKVVGNVQVGTIDSLEQEIVSLKLIIAQLQAQIALLESQMAFLGQDLNNADCFGVVGGSAVEDNCGICDNDLSNDCVQDCFGEWGGTAELDACGECGGSETDENQCDYTLNFDGLDDYVDIPETEDFNFGENNFTWSIWVYPDDFDNYWHTFSRNGVQGQGSIKMNINDGVVYFFSEPGLNSNAVPGEPSNIIPSINAGEWSNIVLVRESLIAKFYINGEFIVQYSGFTNDITKHFIRLGHGHLSEYSDGKMDNASIWNIALTPQQILEYYQEPPLGNEAGLVGYWKFNVVDSDTLYDSSGNGNHGINYGAQWELKD